MGKGYGYGYAWYYGKQMNAHRVSWMIHFGSIPKGKWVLHKCDNKLCVNPNHLYLGTHVDNVLDVIKRPVFGTIVSRFSLDEVNEMRRLHSEGMEQKSLAYKYKCSASYMSEIIRGKVGLFPLEDNKLC